jgi:hypothetical protein
LVPNILLTLVNSVFSTTVSSSFDCSSVVPSQGVISALTTGEEGIAFVLYNPLSVVTNLKGSPATYLPITKVSANIPYFSNNPSAGAPSPTCP